MSKVPVVVPKIGLTAEEVTVERWLKAPGDDVSKGDQIAELMTDKAVLELEAPQTGTLSEIAVKEGEIAPIGSTLAYIDTEA